MDVKNFVLTYYKDVADGFHIQRIERPTEAKKLHSHSYFQIYYIEKGSLLHYLDGNESRLVAGDMFIIPPGVKHKISEEADTVFYSFSFELQSIDGVGFYMDFLKGLMLEKSIRSKITVPSDDVLKIENIIEEIFREFHNKKIASGEVIRSYAVVLITEFARIYYETQNIMPKAYTADNKEFILRCTDYMKENFEKEISLDSMIKLSAMSKSNFCSMFFGVTGKTFNHYLNSLRIHKATEYIRSGYKITAIYGLCGYNDFSTFYRNFKRIMGISPKQYAINNR